nr:nucleotidyl transferase AbiEii/AbiGii toxin family protein [Streptomyces sp. CB01373]
MPELHTRLLADVIALGSPYPLVLTGGYAVRAHRLVSRPSQDLDVATENPAPMADIAAVVRVNTADLEEFGRRHAKTTVRGLPELCNLGMPDTLRTPLVVTDTRTNVPLSEVLSATKVTTKGCLPFRTPTRHIGDGYAEPAGAPP